MIEFPTRVVTMTDSVSGNVFRYTAGGSDLTGSSGINEHLGADHAHYATTAKGCAAFSLSLEDEDAAGILQSGSMPTPAECKALATTIVAALTNSTVNYENNQKSLLGDASKSILGAGSSKRIKKVFLRVVMAEINP